jgi:hypothetical protein
VLHGSLAVTRVLCGIGPKNATCASFAGSPAFAGGPAAGATITAAATTGLVYLLHFWKIKEEPRGQIVVCIQRHWENEKRH